MSAKHLSTQINRPFGNAGAISLVASLMLAFAGCASQGDFLRLQEQVRASQQTSRGSEAFARIAQLSAEVDSLNQKVRDLEGKLDLARKESADALAEIQRTRVTLAQQSQLSGGATLGGVPGTVNGTVSPGGAIQGGSVVPVPNGATVATEPLPAGTPTPAPAPPPPPRRADRELVRYQEALEAWRTDNYGSCIKRFTSFLQSYKTSGYADDAAYWLADCTYKNQEYKRAVIRFSDVVRVYPDSPKAPDALYRQGESLLKLGSRFSDAARTVFRQVVSDYPESKRAPEAKRQLERLGPGSNN